MLGFWIIVCHLIGDYILQSDWMAQNKTKDSRVAFIHAAFCLLPFLFLTRSIPALALMFFTHAAIDRWRLVRYVVWAKNFMAPIGSVLPRWDGQAQSSIPRRNWSWNECKDSFGYAPNAPAFMSIWLMIIADNTIHLLIAGLAIEFL